MRSRLLLLLLLLLSLLLCLFCWLWLLLLYIYIHTLETQTRKTRRVNGKTRRFWQKPEVFQTNTKIWVSTGKIGGQYGVSTGSIRKTEVCVRNPRYFHFVKHTRGFGSDPTNFQGLGSQGVCIYIYMFLYLSIYLSIYLSKQSIYICLCVCVHATSILVFKVSVIYQVSQVSQKVIREQRAPSKHKEPLSPEFVWTSCYASQIHGYYTWVFLQEFLHPLQASWTTARLYKFWPTSAPRGWPVCVYTWNFLLVHFPCFV